MTEVTPGQRRLGQRLRELRRSWDGIQVTQRHIAEALNASTPLVSSWESASAVPPEDRLNAYARFFATRRSMDQDPARLVPAEELSAAEERRREQLVDELAGLREEALEAAGGPRVRDTGALGGRFWYFPDGQPITILCTPLSPRQLGLADKPDEPARGVRPDDPLLVQYARNPTHPNPVYAYNNGDIDALLELVGHVRAENPTATVRWRTYDQIRAVDELSGNVVILGGGDSFGPSESELELDIVGNFTRTLELPFSGAGEPKGDIEFGSRFVVRLDGVGDPSPTGTNEDIYRPRFLLDDSESGTQEPPRRILRNGAPVLEYDVAAIMRKPNPYNGAASVTMCSGLFSRGTYGAVRAFTDERLRARNEQFLYNELKPHDFWMLIQVPVFGGTRTMTPDLARPFHRLRTSS